MTIQITSTTDSPEAVTAAMGDLAQPKTGVELKPEAKEGVELKPEESGETAATEGEETTETLEASTETEESEEVEAKEGLEKPKKKGGFQKKLERQKRENAQLAQEKEYWRQEALRAQQSKGPAEKPETAQQTTDGKPKADDYETPEAFYEALSDWKVDQKLKARDLEQSKKNAQSEVQTKLQKHQERVDKFSEAHDDFDEVIDSISHIPLSITVQEAIVDSDIGPELMYELSKNPEELTRIAKLSPIAAAKEIGKIEARLSKTSKSSTETKTTQAPAPVNPVRAKGAAVKKDIYDPNLSFKEYERLRLEQLKAARR